MKKRLMCLILIFTFSFVFTACGEGEVSQASPIGGKTFTSADDKYELKATNEWTEMSQEASTGATLAIQKNSINYIALADEAKGNVLKKYANQVAKKISDGFETDGKVVISKAKEISVKGNKGYKVTITNDVKDAKLCSNIYSVEIGDRWVQINCVYVKTIQPEMDKVYDDIIQTLASNK
ncbi:MAG: hypothetical protein RSA73_03155 [Anaerovoracaceae bacterium]